MKRNEQTIPLRQAILEVVGEERLQADEIQRLRQLNNAAPRRPERRRWLAAAAVGGSAVLGYWLLGTRPDLGNSQALADEIARNHLAEAPLDILANRLDELRDSFAGLGFGLLDAQELEGVPGELIGARHCSVASVPAALLRYRSEQRIYTVYQARYHAQRHHGAADIAAGEPPVIRHAGGVVVCLCNIHGVLLAVAADSTSAVS